MWTQNLARIGDRTIPYLEAGDPNSSDVVILIHAFPIGMRMWEPTDIPPGWRALAPALPGFDDATLPPADSTSIDDYARAVLELMDHLRIDRAVVGGLSMGGYVTFALWRLARPRWRGLVLADTRASADSEQARAAREKMLVTIRERGTRAVADEMMPKLLGDTTRERQPALVDHVRSMIERQTSEAVAAAVKRLRDRPDSTALLGEIDVPVLVAVGEEDMLTPPSESELMVAALDQARLARIPEAGHLSNMENPAVFSSALAGFLSAFR